MINQEVYNCRFLDLFAGSGAIGIEAISRGAKQAVFVENSRDAVRCIEDNLKRTKLKDQALVMSMDVMSAIKQLDRKGEHFDLVFMDPPYNHMFERDVLANMRDVSFIDEDTLIIFEASLETETDYLESFGYEVVKEKIYKTNKHLFVKRG